MTTSDFRIRDMTAADIDAAVAMYTSAGWGREPAFFQALLANPACRPLVGVVDGAVAATGMATINGSVGWVGSIFVDAALRRHGLGRAITEAVCARIDAAGCTTQALIASDYGRPLYEQMGFRTDGFYRILEAEPVDAAVGGAAGGAGPMVPAGWTLRRVEARDIERIGQLDRRATGEDRRALLGSLRSGGWLLESGDELLGFMFSLEPITAALVTPHPEAAVCLLDLLRRLGRGRTRIVRAAVCEGNVAGRLTLEQQGWHAAFETPRMLRGQPIDWEPGLIWGLLGFAFG
jgi:GNAT superfamily N-acetyltransferase